jgi:glycosyltransferase involved in cell wall biosynthesis
MRRLLLMTIDFPPMKGGVARYLHQLVKFFNNDIIVVSDQKRLLSNRIWPHWIPSVFEFVRRRSDYDTVIISHILPLGLAAMIAKIVTRKPYVVILHGLDIALAGKSNWKRFLVVRILKSAKFVVTNSYALKEEVEANYKIGKTVVVYPSVDSLDKEHDVAHLSDMRQKRDITTLLTVSRLVERKGHLLVLDALARLRDSNKLDGIEYVIVGDGPMEDVIRKRIIELKLENVVELKSGLDDNDLAREYHNSDIFIMPTIVIDKFDREGFGMVYLEAAQHGIPSIASLLPGPDEAVLHEQTGLLVEEGNVDEIMKVILKLAKDSDLRKKLGDTAKKRVQTEFRPEYQFKKIERLL